jgi:hypothetical protein
MEIHNLLGLILMSGLATLFFVMAVVSFKLGDTIPTVVLALLGCISIYIVLFVGPVYTEKTLIEPQPQFNFNENGAFFLVGKEIIWITEYREVEKAKRGELKVFEETEMTLMRTKALQNTKFVVE